MTANIFHALLLTPEWFSTIGRSRDCKTGMWKVRVDIQQGQRLRSVNTVTVIHLNSILRGAHLLPNFGHNFLPTNFDYLMVLVVTT